MNEQQIGARLRELREGKKLSLRGLSRSAGVALSFLSALEKGANSVSVATLKTILDALGVGLGEFFSGQVAAPEKVVYRKDELTEVSGSRQGLRFLEVAAGRAGRALQLILEHYEPEADTGPGLYRHDAEEAGIVLEGKLELTIESETWVLEPGDAYYFDSRRPHRVRNAGRRKARAISVNTPPSF